MYQHTHTDSTSHGGGQLINFSSLQKIVAVLCPKMQETTVRPPREAHGTESGITYKHMCELKPVYGQQLIPLFYERLSRPDLLELCKDLHTSNNNNNNNVFL